MPEIEVRDTLQAELLHKYVGGYEALPLKKGSIKMKIKALSIQEPYVSEILSGEKTEEYRSWKIACPQGILIVGSKSPKGKYAGLAACIVTVSRIEGQKPCYDWVLEDVRPVKPFPVKGKLGLYEVDAIIEFLPSV